MVGGNWKSNGSLDFCKNFTGQVLNPLDFDSAKVDVVVAPSHLHLLKVDAHLTNRNVQLAAQNVSLTGPGAYTGEHSAEMIKDMGVNWTLTGHSERRSLFNETDTDVATKTKCALKIGMKVFLCIGE